MHERSTFSEESTVVRDRKGRYSRNRPTRKVTVAMQKRFSGKSDRSEKKGYKQQRKVEAGPKKGFCKVSDTKKSAHDMQVNTFGTRCDPVSW